MLKKWKFFYGLRLLSLSPCGACLNRFALIAPKQILSHVLIWFEKIFPLCIDFPNTESMWIYVDKSNNLNDGLRFIFNRSLFLFFSYKTRLEQFSMSLHICFNSFLFHSRPKQKAKFSQMCWSQIQILPIRFYASFGSAWIDLALLHSIWKCTSFPSAV